MPRPRKAAPHIYRSLKELTTSLGLGRSDAFTLEFQSGYAVVEGTVRATGVKVIGRFQLDPGGYMSPFIPWQLDAQTVEQIKSVLGDNYFLRRMLDLPVSADLPRTAERFLRREGTDAFAVSQGMPPVKHRRKVAKQKVEDPDPSIRMERAAKGPSRPKKAVKKTMKKTTKKTPNKETSPNRPQAHAAKRVYTKDPTKKYGGAAHRRRRVDETPTMSERKK